MNVIFYKIYCNMDVPSYILKLLDIELKDIQLQLLKKISEKYNISFESLKEDFIETAYLKILPEKDEKIIIYKTQKARIIPEENDRCIANIWGRGKGGRCSRKIINDDRLCKQHTKGLKHGTIYDSDSGNSNSNGNSIKKFKSKSIIYK